MNLSINKGTLSKTINNNIECIYPKTSSDMVMHEGKTVEDKLSELDNTLQEIDKTTLILYGGSAKDSIG